MNPSGILLDTSPLVALLSTSDTDHELAKNLFAKCRAPFRCCEAVIAEACFLMRRIHPDGPAEVLALGRKGVYETPFALNEHLSNLETLCKKYKNRPISLADACLIRCAEVFQEPRILSLDSDFRVYRWGRNKPFQFID
jgi:predicted nucleic acid-binding protein